MASLTRTEAIERARTISVDDYTVSLDLTGGPDGFDSVSTVRFRCAEPGDGTFVELVGELKRAELNGRTLEATAYQDNRIFLTAAELAADATNVLVVEARMSYSNSGEGLHRFVDPADGEVYLYAQSFLDNAQRIFACFDQFDIKAPVTLTVRAPAEWTVIANNDPVRAEGGEWEFATTKPIPPYLFAVCAGPYHSVRSEHDGIKIGLHCRRSLAEFLDRDVDELLTITTGAFDWYHRKFDRRYPFDGAYDQVFVPEFNAGAMENPGCVTFRDEYVFRSAVTEQEREERAIVISHELAHMWFGNLVTMRWGDDLWLNESFAEYMGERVAAEATPFNGSAATTAGGRKAHAYLADQRPSTHPVAADVPDYSHILTNFDMISYAKGAAVQRQLAALLGDDVFFAGLNRHFDNHAYGNAEMADLISTLSEISGRSLDEWAKVWVTRAQVNTLSAVERVTEDGDYAGVDIAQKAPDSHPVLRPHQIRIGRYDLIESAAGKPTLERVGGIEVEITDALTPVPELTGVRVPDLLLLNDGDLGYAKIRLAGKSAHRLPELVTACPDRLTRALIYTAAMTAMRDGELSTEDYLGMALAAIEAEPHPGSLSLHLMRWARAFAADRYLAPERRNEMVVRMAGALRSVFERTDIDRGRKLAAVREFVSCALTESDLDTLTAWLTGNDVPADIEMDTDLRWQVLRRLAVTGRAGAAEVDEWERRDTTAFGAVQAAAARASLPDPEAKAAAWRALMADDSLPNRKLTAIADGFWQPEQRELTLSYEPGYFRDIVPFAARVSPWIANQVAGRAFPIYAIDEATVRTTEALAESAEVPPGIRRILVDQAYELRLALFVRREKS